MSGERGPVRPSIPLGAWPAAGVWFGTIAAESWSWSRWADRGPAWFVALGCVVLVALGLKLRRRPAIALLVIAVIAGFAAGVLYWSQWDSDVQALTRESGRRMTLEASSDARAGRFGTKQEAVIVDGAASGSRLTVRWPADSQPPEFGYTAAGYARYVSPKPDEWGRLAHRDGKRGAVALRVPDLGPPARSLSGFVAPARKRWHERLGELDGPGAGILEGVLIGDGRRLADTPTDAALRACGLTHLVAVSGGHLVVVASLASALLGLTPLGKKTSSVAVLLMCGLYVLASGVQASAVRAFVMACVACLATLAERRADAAAALSATVAGCLLVEPPLAFDLGFSLSTMAVAGLVLFGQLAESWVAPLLPGVTRSGAGALGMTFVAQATTMPLTVPVFGTLSLIAPIANVPAAVLISVALPAGLLGLLVADVIGPLGMAALRFALFLTSLCARLAETLAALPGAVVPLSMRADVAGVLVLGALIGVWAVWPRATAVRSCLCALVSTFVLMGIVVGPRGPAGLEVRVLDIGQGDSILLRDGGRAMLVDTGASETALRQALARCGVRRLDYLLLTHGHEDHAGALGALDGLVRVRQGLVSALEGEGDDASVRELSRVADSIERVEEGDVWQLGATTVTAVWPTENGTDPEGNDASIVLVVQRGDFACLLTGDAESMVLDQLVRSAAVGDIDVLKVGHHGSAAAVSEESLVGLDPEVALISVGADNRFGHPTGSTLAQLRDCGVDVLRTDEQGDLVVGVLGDGRYRVAGSR